MPANHIPDIALRKTLESDLEILFAFQMEDTAAHMAAFMSDNWQNKAAYLSKWTNNLKNPENNNNTILVDGVIAGSVFTYKLFGETQISYWIGKNWWGKGIATNALSKFLEANPQRPVYGRVAFDNAGSARVLGKCGFKYIGTDKYFATTRGKEIDELIFLLE